MSKDTIDKFDYVHILKIPIITNQIFLRDICFSDINTFRSINFITYIYIVAFYPVNSNINVFLKRLNLIMFITFV